jgi:hypothetical protein
MSPQQRISSADILAEAKHLARQAVTLANKGSKYAAIWGGTGIVPPPKGEWEHRISFSASHLPDNPKNRKGVISVYICTEDSDRFNMAAVTHDPVASLPRKTDGLRLYARPVECMPPPDIVLWFGREPIQDWIRSNGWSLPGWNVNMAGSAPVKDYWKRFRSEYPGYDKTVYSMLGGWSDMFGSYYPRADWLKLATMPLLAMSRGSEPWLEVYEGSKKLLAYSRGT